jgi:hypothetical protein
MIAAPGYVDTDFSLLKNTRIKERLNVQFRAEIFNIFNHANFGIPDLNAFTAVGGTEWIARRADHVDRRDFTSNPVWCEILVLKQRPNAQALIPVEIRYQSS